MSVMSCGGWSSEIICMITNKNKILSEKEIVCKTFFSQVRGLMFRKKQNLIMIFGKEKKISLHMFFVFYPIDVLLLNENGEIVEIKRNLRPFTFWSSKEKGKYVVELAFPGGYKVGDRVEVKV